MHLFHQYKDNAVQIKRAVALRVVFAADHRTGTGTERFRDEKSRISKTEISGKQRAHNMQYGEHNSHGPAFFRACILSILIPIIFQYIRSCRSYRCIILSYSPTG